MPDDIDPFIPVWPTCITCRVGRCDECLGRDGSRWCEHECRWLVGDLPYLAGGLTPN